MSAVTAPRPEVRGFPSSSDMGSSYERAQPRTDDVSCSVYVAIMIGPARQQRRQITLR